MGVSSSFAALCACDKEKNYLYLFQYHQMLNQILDVISQKMYKKRCIKTIYSGGTELRKRSLAVADGEGLIGMFFLNIIDDIK